MNRITVTFPYYKNPQMLAYQIGIWKRYPEGIEVVLVDDGSPIGQRAEEIISAVGEPLCPFKLFRIMVDLAWNEGGARNLAVENATFPWVLIADIDHIVTPSLLVALQLMPLDERTVYGFTRIEHTSRAINKSHKECCIMSKALYDESGGIDESYCGHYGFPYREWNERLAKYPRVEIPLPLERVTDADIPDCKTFGLTRKEGRDVAFWDDVREWKRINNVPIQRLKLPWKRIL